MSTFLAVIICLPLGIILGYVLAALLVRFLDKLPEWLQKIVKLTLWIE